MTQSIAQFSVPRACGQCSPLRPVLLATKAVGRAAITTVAVGAVVRDGSGKQTAWHNGDLAAASSLLIHRADGMNLVLLINERAGTDGKNHAMALNPQLRKVIGAISKWPTHDLFPKAAKRAK